MMSICQHYCFYCFMFVVLSLCFGLLDELMFCCSHFAVFAFLIFQF